MWYVGFDNYKRIFADSMFWDSFKIPLFLLLVQVPLMIFLATMIAFLYEARKVGACLQVHLLPALHNSRHCLRPCLVLYFLGLYVTPQSPAELVWA